MSGTERQEPNHEDFEDFLDDDWCRYCGGEGAGEENDLESDWINFGSDIVTCRFCKGTGKASVSGLW